MRTIETHPGRMDTPPVGRWQGTMWQRLCLSKRQQTHW